MGKIRVKTFGDEEAEQKQKEEAEKRKETKKTVKAPGGKGGERVVSVGPSQEELEALDSAKQNENEAEIEEEKPHPAKALRGKKEKFKEKKEYHSQKYQFILGLVDKAKIYTIGDALDLLEKLQRKNFDETVELHLNTNSTGISGNVTLPNGTGKKTKVAIADDKLIAEIEKGIISFDILVAKPEMMVKLAKVAKVLGPKGLMPNPKNGTITQNPEEVAKKYEGGQVNFKTEAKSPLMHLTVGKMSFGKEKLTQNLESLITAIKKSNIKDATLKSTMSPGIKIKA